MAVMPSTNGTTSPVYDPMQSMPTAGGPATNRAAGSSAYAPADMATIIVGFSKGAKRPKDPHQAKLFGDTYEGTIRKTPAQLLQEFENLSRKDFLKFRNILIAAGYVSEGADALAVRDAYEGLLGDVFELQQSGRTTLTPGSLLNNLIRMNGLDPKKIGGDEDFSTAIKEQAKPSSSTQTSVYDLTPEDARATLEAAMYQKLGRNPTDEEIEDFIAAAQTRAERNPTRVTQSFRPGVAGGEGDQVQVDREGGQVVGTTVTNVDEGFDEESLVRMAEKRAMDAPDYGAYQSVSRFFPAFLNALGATAPGV